MFVAGTSPEGKAVYLRDIWPTRDEIQVQDHLCQIESHLVNVCEVVSYVMSVYVRQCHKSVQLRQYHMSCQFV